MSVHYKFKSALEYDTVNFDGLHISVKDLKSAIIQAKRIGKNTDFDLQVTNAQTKEVYEDEEALIPKNTSLLIARIPLAASNKAKAWEGYGGDSTPPSRTDDGGPISKAVDLSSLDASEDDKIKAMMSQSTQDYDPSNYMKIRGANQVGAVPPNYRCYKCHQSGHWIKDCPLSQGPEPMEIKKSTGIPRSFMVPVDGPQVPGAMMTPNGSYAVPRLDHQTYSQPKAAPPPVVEAKPEIPEDLLCSICTDLLTDAVMIPCCGNSFCDECIRSTLLESDEHECPDCHERNISPATLIPNRFLRNSVSNFKNTTGYIKRPVVKFTPIAVHKAEVKIQKEATPPPNDSSKENISEATKADSIEKTIISEADSTQPKKSSVDFSEDIEVSNLTKDPKILLPEGPPGVSPKHEDSPKPKESSKSRSKSSKSQNGSEREDKHRSHDRERRKHSQRSPYNSPPLSHEERSGTPTVDEPGMTSGTHNSNYPPNSAGPYATGPPGVLPPMMNMGPPPHIQGPPNTSMPPGPYPPNQHPPGVYPPSQGPPPNFRLPPPGAAPGPGPYMPPGPYNMPPRPMYDQSRPPITGPPPYQNYPPGARTRSREYPRSGIRGRTPPTVIDDPLEAFNRMLREKDEQKRRARQRKGRSYSRSSSRSYSRSPRRQRSRSPRRRSRSRSFSISRSRSRSFSPSPRQSPYREYSPRPLSPRRRPPSRYRSPARSPPRYRYKDAPPSDRPREREYERDGRDNRERPREYGSQRDDRGYNQRENDYRDDRRGDRDYHYYDNYGDRDRGRPKSQWNQGGIRVPPQDQYYPPLEVHQQQAFAPTNRYPRDAYPSYKPDHHIPPVQPIPPRRYDDVVPPGTEQPPIPGEEPPPRYEDHRYGYPADSQTNRFSSERDTRHKEGEARRNDQDKQVDRNKEERSREDRPREDRPRDDRPRDDRPRDDRPRDERPRDDRSRDDRNRDDRSRDDRTRDERSRDDRTRDDRTRDDRSRDDKAKEDRNKDDRNREDRSRDDRTRDERSREDRNRDDRFRDERYRDERYDRSKEDRLREEKSRDDRNKDDYRKEEKGHRHEKYSSRSPTSRSNRNPSPIRPKDRYESPDKHKKKRRDESSEKIDKRDDRRAENDKHHKRDYSDDEKLKKIKDKKRKKEKKELEKKKRKEKKERREEKHKKSEEKERKSKVRDKNPEESNDEDDKLCLKAKDDEHNGEPTGFQNDSTNMDNKEEKSDWEDETPRKVQRENSEPGSDHEEYKSKKESDCIEESQRRHEEHKSKMDCDDYDSKDVHKHEGEINEYTEEEVADTSKEYDDVLELHSSHNELKAEAEMLAPVPEKSKWEIDDDNLNTQSQFESDSETKTDKTGKVTNEVLKRAENAIFAKAINAIRPIEIKKISGERAKLYSGEKDNKRHEDVEVRNIQVTIPTIATYDIEEGEVEVVPPGTEPVKVESEITKPPPRLSVKERLGVKVDDLDRIVRVDNRNRSRSLSPFSKRNMELDERRRYDGMRDKHGRSYRNPDRSQHGRRDNYRSRDEMVRQDRRTERRDEKRDVKEERHSRFHQDKHDKRKHSKSPTPDRKKRDKKHIKDKSKKHKQEGEEEPMEKISKNVEEPKPKPVSDRRKPTLDEANFEPDYDLETESEKEEEKKIAKKRSASKSPDPEIKRPKIEEKKVSSSSDSSDSSSEEEKRKKKKHKKHKKKSKRGSSSSRSETDSESSGDDHKKKKKHKKNKKKKKKSKHK